MAQHRGALFKERPQRPGERHAVRGSAWISTLTSTMSIKLNGKLSLRPPCASLRSTSRTLPWVRDCRVAPWQRGHHPTASLFERRFQMKPNDRYQPLDVERSLNAAAVEFWHVWSAPIPRRSITGKLVWGRVWRRHNGERWQYASMDTPKSVLVLVQRDCLTS